VLIQGESGTGKELVARLVHYWSDRVGHPFVAVNCKAFAESVLESELFGHEKGAFTGALAARQGCFERASGGTLLLDEIGDISAEFQAKLLRVLQEGEVLRVGGSEPRRINVRVVAATNSSLQDKVAAGSFREDLYFRLNVIPIQLLPLRDRREDILALARNFLARMAAQAGRHMTLNPEAAEMLLRHSWPGNVRELENAIERAVVLTRADAITAADLMLDRVLPRNLRTRRKGWILSTYWGSTRGSSPIRGSGRPEGRSESRRPESPGQRRRGHPVTPQHRSRSPACLGCLGRRAAAARPRVRERKVTGLEGVDPSTFGGRGPEMGGCKPAQFLAKGLSVPKL
jgi:transcriptional regulator with GAF, ATPase, and Fis domain